jgi:riboflavin kinase/FMN adenylyltransferase
VRTYRGLDSVARGDLREPVAATVGVFDGVHKGHRRILDELVRWAREGGGSSVVVTFDRHPREVLRGEKPAAIQSLEHRLVLLERVGIDAAWILPFDRATASIEAEAFVRDFLVGRLGVKRVLLGADHRFGKDRRGDIALLERLGPRLGFEARGVPLEASQGSRTSETISSTAIRDAIREGRLEDAERLLGRPVSVLGEVVRGEARGRFLGFPTANLDLHHEARPPRGVYACLVALGEGGRPPEEGAPLRLAVANIGRRPTFHPEGGEDLVEVHLLDLDMDLYGRTLEVFFLMKLREERRFAGPHELAQQIRADIAETRSRFS